MSLKSWHPNTKHNRSDVENRNGRSNNDDKKEKKQTYDRIRESEQEELQRMSKSNGNQVSFMYKAPPGLLPEEKKSRPEDAIPDTEANKKAREFLKNAPTKGLWMPLGQEVKVMQCFRCKNYGHRTGDRDCPLFLQGNISQDMERKNREDPMSGYIQNDSETKQKKMEDKMERIKQLQSILEESKKKLKEKKDRREKSSKKEKKHKKHKKEKKRRRDSSSSSSSSSESEGEDRHRKRPRESIEK